MPIARTALAASLATLLSLGLAACSGTSDTGDTALPDAAEAPAASAPAPVDAPTAPAAMTCDAGVVQALVGQPSDDAVIEQARTDSGAGTVRVLKPGDAATMDYREDRLNIDLDADGVIQSLRCG